MFNATMGDFRVWVDGVERVVRGANEETTCENILLALASATGKLGRFALVEKWRDLERILPREAKPLKCLQMWGKQASEVKFVLKLMKDKSTGILGEVAVKQLGQSEEENLFHKDENLRGNFDGKYLERVVANQTNKLKRLARDLEILQLRIDCSVEDEENYLYFTEEEITDDRITKFGQVLKLQAKELEIQETCACELAGERTRQEKLQFELKEHRSKLKNLDVHISDLENVGSKIYSMRAPQDIKSDNVPSLSGDDRSELDELAQEIMVTREELSKQRDLAERQIEEVKVMKRSFAELEILSQQKSVELLSLKGESSPDPSVYYDLDKNLNLDTEHDLSASYGTGNLDLRRDKPKMVIPDVYQSSSNGGIPRDLSSPGASSSRKSEARQKFLVDGFDGMDDPGVFV